MGGNQPRLNNSIKIQYNCPICNKSFVKEEKVNKV